MFQEFSETERQTIKFWIELLNEWQERSRRKAKTKFDEIFVGHVKYMHPDIEIGTDILHRNFYSFILTRENRKSVPAIA